MANKKNSEDRIAPPEKLEALEQRVFIVVKHLVDKADLEQLLKVGAPSDEYDPESRYIAKEIVSEGYKKVGVTAIAHIIALVFHMEFQRWGEPVRYFSIYFDLAKEIQAKIQKL
jgi:hypothetical protein